jgi:lipopolysaccharide transport system ATP-binding protein
MSSSSSIVVSHISKDYYLGLTGRKNSLAKIVRDRARHPLRRGGRKREGFRALDDVSFEVEEGSAVGVIGKNGAGKSTLLKIISRITPPSTGYIEMAGTVGSLLEVGTGFNLELTGIENVYLNGTILGMTKRQIDRRLDEIVAFAEVDKFLDTPVKRYSSGMRVRLAFAVAAHLDPEILIVDEVLSVGDAGFQAKCLAKMRSIAGEEGRTVLFVSHNLVTVEHFCPRALLMANGRLVYDGPTAETVKRYMQTFPMGQPSASAGVFDLAAADRSGDGYDKVFKQLQLRPHGGPPADSVRMGDRLRIEIECEGLDPSPNPFVQITFRSTVSQNLIRMRSTNLPLRAASGRRRDETVVIDIPSVLLTPGDYYLHLVARDSLNTKIDEVDRAGELTVLPADVLGTGYQFTHDDGMFYMPWEWELRPTTHDALDVDSARGDRQAG